MHITQIDDRFAIDNDGERLELCPCCGNTFNNEAAAEVVLKALKSGEIDWDEAMEDQDAERAKRE